MTHTTYYIGKIGTDGDGGKGWKRKSRVDIFCFEEGSAISPGSRSRLSFFGDERREPVSWSDSERSNRVGSWLVSLFIKFLSYTSDYFYLCEIFSLSLSLLSKRFSTDSSFLLFRFAPDYFYNWRWKGTHAHTHKTTPLGSQLYILPRIFFFLDHRKCIAGLKKRNKFSLYLSIALAISQTWNRKLRKLTRARTRARAQGYRVRWPIRYASVADFTAKRMCACTQPRDGYREHVCAEEVGNFAAWRHHVRLPRVLAGLSWIVTTGEWGESLAKETRRRTKWKILAR